MKKDNIKRVVCAALLTAMLTGCSEDVSNCNNPTKHAHKYSIKFNDGSKIEKYIESENLERGNLSWQEDYFLLTNDDEKFLNVINNNGLFVGKENWKYLYNKMKGNHDYLKFYYYYTETRRVLVTKTRYNSDGELETYTEWENRTETYSGWSTNPNHHHNTGEVKIVHTKYYGYKIVENSDGELDIKQSPYVDDIRYVMKEYPYVKGDNECKFEYKIPHRYSKDELPYLKVSDFNHFGQPDLTNTTPELSADVKTRKLI